VKRQLALLVAVLSAAALLSGCGSAGAASAAKVGSATISRTTLDDDLSQLAGNSTWIKAVQQNFNGNLAAPAGGISSQLSAAWLNTLVNQQIIDRTFKSRHLKVTPALQAEAKQATLGILAGNATYMKFAPWFRNEMLHRQERYAAVAASLPTRPPPTEAVLRDFFTRVGSQLCPTGLAVLRIRVPTEADANAVGSALAGGADFATLAALRSTDAGSKSVGGLIACKDTQQYAALDAGLRQAVTPLASGSVSGPVPVAGSFEIYKVVPWSYDVAHGVLAGVYEQQLASPISKFVQAQLVKTKVWVDPRYGTVARRGGTVVIHPPTVPNPNNRPKPAPSTTTPAGATGP
jgi:hypothetical protein